MPEDITCPLTEQEIDDIILTGGHRNAAGGIYATSVYAFAKEVAVAAVLADREGREPVAWLTRTDEGDPSMLFFDYDEACAYCNPDEPPEALVLRDFAADAQRAEPGCGCQTCRPITMTDMRMVLCETCGNKRCPHATDHRHACTGSNEPGQPGSSYGAQRAKGDA